MNDAKAREIVARERARVESLLAGLRSDTNNADSLRSQQTGERADSGSDLESESVDLSLTADVRAELAAVKRAEERIALRTYGRSVESGLPIPDERLEAEPLAERTVEEQRLFELGNRN